MSKNILKRLSLFKTRTKLLILFVLMLSILIFSNLEMKNQIKDSNVLIESQARILVQQGVLTDTVSCFGDIKYWFAILDNELNKNTGGQDLSSAAGKAIKCPLEVFENYIVSLETVSLKKAQSISNNFQEIRSVPLNAMNAYIEEDTAKAEKIMAEAYHNISSIDATLNELKINLNHNAGNIIEQVLDKSEYLQHFPVITLLFGSAFIMLIALIIFVSIFKPIEKITSTMIDASKDPQNTRDYIIYDEREDELGDAMSALNSLLLQVSLGINRIKEAEREIAATAQKLDAIFNSVGDGLIAVNSEGEIESFNQSAYKIFGYTSQNADHVKITDLLSNEFADEYNTGIKHFISSGDTKLVGSEPIEMMGSRADKSEFPLELSVSSIPSDEGKPIFVSVVRDVTYRKELERQLLHAQKMEALGSLSSGIAHEINTPTQYVGDNLKFLQEAFEAYEAIFEAYQELAGTEAAGLKLFKQNISKAEEEQDLEFFKEEVPLAVKQSLEGISTISEIVGAVKGFSYPATDEKMLLNLNEALQNTIVVSRNQWKSVADLDTKFDEDLPLVPCIPGKLTQVILNLIVNAAHAIEENDTGPSANAHKITISTSHTENYVTIKVTDTGMGVPEHIIGKIFDPFFTTKDVGKGTGQGLAISYDIIVGQHDGSLDVLSNEGEGATFIITLPLTAKENSLKDKAA